MNSFQSNAIINYYCRLINRGAYELEDVPVQFLSAVKEKLKDMLPYKPREGETE